MSRSSTRDELLSGGFANSSNTLLRTMGGWGNISGPGLVMVRVFTAGAVTSIFFGATGAIFCSLLYGTAGLPFVLCSCAGYIVGALGFYNDAIRKSRLYLDRYPRLLQIHLDANFPSLRFNSWPRDRLRSSNFTTWTLREMLMIGYLSAMPAIENIVDADEQQAVEQLAIPSEKET